MKINVVDESGAFLGNMEFDAAVSMAKSKRKDLVLINSRSNTYKIADSGKLKYEQKQREKQQREHQRTNKVKEIKLRPAIDQHDLDIKADQARDFLRRGLKTKIVMTFRGRQLVNKEAALGKFNSVYNQLISEGLAVCDSAPRLEGREISALLVPPPSNKF
jgi:translation initiation factor IF-3